jgi:hypothetical protein
LVTKLKLVGRQKLDLFRLVRPRVQLLWMSTTTTKFLLASLPQRGRLEDGQTSRNILILCLSTILNFFLLLLCYCYVSPRTVTRLHWRNSNIFSAYYYNFFFRLLMSQLYILDNQQQWYLYLSKSLTIGGRITIPPPPS